MLCPKESCKTFVTQTFTIASFRPGLQWGKNVIQLLENSTDFDNYIQLLYCPLFFLAFQKWEQSKYCISTL